MAALAVGHEHPPLGWMQILETQTGNLVATQPAPTTWPPPWPDPGNYAASGSATLPDRQRGVAAGTLNHAAPGSNAPRRSR
jgi:hypothetical protein